MNISHLDFPHTCPKIDKTIETLKKLAKAYKEGNPRCDTEVFLIDYVLPEIEYLRDINDKMRDAADKQIEELVTKLEENG